MLSDLLISIATGLLASWLSALAIGLGWRLSWVRAALNRVFGGARGALFVPPLFGVAVAVAACASHRDLFLWAPLNSSLSADGDGCLHWTAHGAGGGVTVLAIAVGGSLALLVSHILFRLRAKYCILRGLLAAIDRSATRSIRTSVHGIVNSRRVFAVDGLSVHGPLVARAPRGPLILLPRSLDFGRDELAAVVAHERAHIDRAHLVRRWIFESLLTVALPRFLVGPCIVQSRVEDECEADDDAAVALRSRRLVAHALVRAAESVDRHKKLTSMAQLAFMVPQTDLSFRVQRLLNTERPAPSRLVPGVAVALLVCGIAAASIVAMPVASVWAFCQLETLLGMSCA